jgi:hypothetical protein
MCLLVVSGDIKATSCSVCLSFKPVTCILVRRSINHEALEMIIPPYLDINVGVMTVKCKSMGVLFSV